MGNYKKSTSSPTLSKATLGWCDATYFLSASNLLWSTPHSVVNSVLRLPTHASHPRWCPPPLTSGPWKQYSTESVLYCGWRQLLLCTAAEEQRKKHLSNERKCQGRVKKSFMWSSLTLLFLCCLAAAALRLCLSSGLSSWHLNSRRNVS